MKSIWTEEFIRGIFERASTIEGAQKTTGGQLENRYLVWKMLMVIYNRQHPDEKTAKTTKHHNKKGFTPADAGILSDIAQKSIQYKNLTPAQCAKIVAPRMMKYAAQLVRFLKEKEQANIGKPIISEPDFNEQWAAHKAAFAKQEQEMEEAAFLSKMPLM